MIILPIGGHLLLINPYFNLNHWLGEMDAENSQALIYAKESDEILKKLSLKSSEGGFKITIVWLPEKMHPVCANKLLKLLEEPPEKTIFLLVSEAPDMILPTILSRTQRMNVRKIDEASIDRVLQSKYNMFSLRIAFRLPIWQTEISSRHSKRFI